MTNKNMKEKTLEDMTVLKDILDGKISIKDVDNNQKERLIKLCNRRTSEINKKIEEKEKEIKSVQEILSNII